MQCGVFFIFYIISYLARASCGVFVKQALQISKQVGVRTEMAYRFAGYDRVIDRLGHSATPVAKKRIAVNIDRVYFEAAEDVPAPEDPVTAMMGCLRDIAILNPSHTMK